MILTKNDIERVSAKAASVKHAAELLGVTKAYFSKCAALYFTESGESYLDYIKQKGSRNIPLTKGYYSRDRMSSILKGDQKNTLMNLVTFKHTLIHHGFFADQCGECGYCTKRAGDFESPIIIDFLDNDRENGKQDNIRFICLNCAFLDKVPHQRVYFQQVTPPEIVHSTAEEPVIERPVMKQSQIFDSDLQRSINNLGIFDD